MGKGRIFGILRRALVPQAGLTLAQEDRRRDCRYHLSMSRADTRNTRTRRSNFVSLRVFVVTYISAGHRVRHHLSFLHAIPAAETTDVVPAPVRAVARIDAPLAAVAAQTADELPQAACIDARVADLPAANRTVAADCTAAQAVKVEAPRHRWSSALLARAAAHGLHGRDPHRVRDRFHHP
jgi:hypothetical protein